MKSTLKLLPWLLLPGLLSSAGADEVILKNGGKLQGTVTEEGNKVSIDVGSGVITIDRSEVKSISRPDELNREYDRRMKDVKADDPNAHYQVYLWTRQQEGLKGRSERLLRKILEIDPNHEQAHRALGQVNYKGAWLTQDELKAALGLVRYNGDWVTSESAEKLRRLDQERAAAQLKEDAEARKTEAQLEIERQRLAWRQRVLDMIESGELPNPMIGTSAPWGGTYWGPTLGASKFLAD